MSRNVLANKKLSPLLDVFKKEGFKVVLVPNSNKIGKKSARGAFFKKGKEVLVVKRDHLNKTMTLGDVAFVLAHELRHLQHYKNGWYEEYYKERKIGDKPCDFETAYSAELDCDRYAKEYIKGLGLKSRFSHRTYPKSNVYGYEYYEIEKKFGPYLARILWLTKDALKKAKAFYDEDPDKFRKMDESVEENVLLFQKKKEEDRELLKQFLMDALKKEMESLREEKDAI